MPMLTHRDFEEQLSLYVDGELADDALRDFEDYVKNHPEAERELAAYRRMQNVLSGQAKLQPNPGFWSDLRIRLEERREENENLLPFPRKHLPAAIAITSIAVLAVAVVVYGERGSIFDFLTKKSQEVQTAFQENLLQGTIVPLFADLDRDHVLRYALFGTLPLDEESDRALRVDETSEQGYRIEMGSTVKQNAPRVTVRDFIAEVEPTERQTEAIDSVLDDVRKQIESSAFYAENNAIAIDPELTKLNKATLASIASVLEPAQRARFDVFLKKHGATYVVASEDQQTAWHARVRPERGEKILKSGLAARPYVVVTPDTFVYTQLHVNLQQFEQEHQELVRLRQKREQDLVRLVDRIQRVREPETRALVRGEEPIVVQGGTGYVSIQIHGALVAGPEDSVLQVVTRRPDQPKFFRHEFEGEGGTMVFEYRMQISTSLDSMVEAEMSRARDFQRKLEQQDSILKAQRRSGGIYVAPDDTVRRKRMF